MFLFMASSFLSECFAGNACRGCDRQPALQKSCPKFRTALFHSAWQRKEGDIELCMAVTLLL